MNTKPKNILKYEKIIKKFKKYNIFPMRKKK